MLLLQPHSALLSNLCQWLYCNDIDVQVLRTSTSTKERNRRAVWGCSSVYEQPDKTSAAPSSSNSARPMQPLELAFVVNNCLLWLEKKGNYGKTSKTRLFISSVCVCASILSDWQQLAGVALRRGWNKSSVINLALQPTCQEEGACCVRARTTPELHLHRVQLHKV